MTGYLPASTYPFAVNFCVGLIQIVLVVYGSKISNTMRLVPCFIIVGIIMVILPFLANIGGAVAYWSCFSILVFLGIFYGAAQGTVFAMAAAFPFKYMGAVMVGNGIAGIGSNLVRAATLKAFPADEGVNNQFYGALTMFSVSLLIMVLCAVA